MNNFQPTANTTLKRLPERGSFDRATVNAILDEGFICHVAFVIDGQPFVIPTSYVRIDDMVFIHGSAASRMLRSLSSGIPVCVTVTLIDALVLARSAFHHSINYRSVVILGTATSLEDSPDKMAALRAFMEHVVPGRWSQVREPTEQELRATTVLSLPLAEVSAKIRTGPPKDDAEDYALPVWAGELPLRLLAGTPVADSTGTVMQPVPDYILRYERRAKNDNNDNET
jgi:nitroimidazol reductase NimA-like FMN-containing flavoprotein (pyridoxamine 5'-phosphate oxidase superfamily)